MSQVSSPSTLGMLMALAPERLARQHIRLAQRHGFGGRRRIQIIAVAGQRAQGFAARLHILGHVGLALDDHARPCDQCNQRFAFGPAAVGIDRLAAARGLLRKAHQRRIGQSQAQHFGVGDRGDVDGTPGIQ